MTTQNQKTVKERVWGPSVAHCPTCNKRQSEEFDCSCPKRFYCEGCDAMHYDRKCPRTVLDDIAEHLSFKEKTQKQLINEILEAADARNMYFYTIEQHIRSRIDELAERYGNLGLSRRQLFRLAKKEWNRRQRREHRRAWREQHGRSPF